MGKRHWEGERKSSEAQKPPREVLRSTGRQSHLPATSAAHPWVLQSITAQSRVCKPPGPAQGWPVSQWRCLPRQGLSTHCPAAWRQLLRITNTANNSQEVTGPQPCPSRPKHGAGTQRCSRVGESHQGREFWCLRLSPSPIQAEQEQNELFPWTRGRPFIFIQDPVEEEDLLGIYRQHCRPQPP